MPHGKGHTRTHRRHAGVEASVGGASVLSGVGFFKDSEGWSLVNLRKPLGTQYLQIDLSCQRSYTAHMGPSPKNLPLKGGAGGRERAGLRVVLGMRNSYRQHNGGDDGRGGGGSLKHSSKPGSPGASPLLLSQHLRDQTRKSGTEHHGALGLHACRTGIAYRSPGSTPAVTFHCIAQTGTKWLASAFGVLDAARGCS